MDDSHDSALGPGDLALLQRVVGGCARSDSKDGRAVDDLVLRAWELMHDMGLLILDERYDEFADFVEANHGILAEEAFCDEDVAHLIHLGYAQGLARCNGRCAASLGALYEHGSIVGRDPKRASELYAQAAAWDRSCS